MGEATSRCPTIAEYRIRSQVIRCGIYGGQAGTGIGFSPSISVFPYISIFSPFLHTHISLICHIRSNVTTCRL